jgi:hypothetical protein
VKNFLCATDNFVPPLILRKVRYNYLSLIKDVLLTKTLV